MTRPRTTRVPRALVLRYPPALRKLGPWASEELVRRHVVVNGRWCDLLVHDEKLSRAVVIRDEQAWIGPRWESRPPEDPAARQFSVADRRDVSGVPAHERALARAVVQSVSARVSNGELRADRAVDEVLSLLRFAPARKRRLSAAEALVLAPGAYDHIDDPIRTRNRHDARRWFRCLHPLFVVASDALLAGRRDLAIGVLCGALRLDDVIGLTARPLDALDFEVLTEAIYVSLCETEGRTVANMALGRPVEEGRSPVDDLRSLSNRMAAVGFAVDPPYDVSPHLDTGPYLDTGRTPRLDPSRSEFRIPGLAPEFQLPDPIWSRVAADRLLRYQIQTGSLNDRVAAAIEDEDEERLSQVASTEDATP